MEADKYNHYEVESVTSKRHSIGEMLAAMQPECNGDVEKFGPPVDFSFRDARKMSDFTKATPRQGVHSYVTIPVTLPSIEPAPSVTPSGETKQAADDDTKTKHVKYSSKAIRFSNNSISSFDGFGTTLQAVLQSTETLEWLDISFNDLTKISEAILELSNLKVLYLHANVIDDIKQVDKLAGLPNLKTLTLHGNIIDGVKGYRQYVVTEIPHLQYFDFSRITKADRDKAVTWRQLKIIGHHKKKKKSEKKE